MSVADTTQAEDRVSDKAGGQRARILGGAVTNVVCVILLVGVGFALEIPALAAVSLGVNWLVFFIHALPQDSEKLFDITGTLTYLTLMIWAIVEQHWLTGGFPGLWSRGFILVALAAFWAIRLGSFLLTRVCQVGKDSRFDDLRTACVLWMCIWSIQAVWCFLVISPVLVIIKQGDCSALSWPDYAAFGLWVFGIIFEVIADGQKDAFRKNPANKGKWIDTGLWAYSRHPNYFGEIVMWVAITAGVSSADCLRPLQYLIWLSPVTTFILLKFVTGVPLLEKQGQERWGDNEAYQSYVKSTPEIVPTCCRPPAFVSSQPEAKDEAVSP